MALLCKEGARECDGCMACHDNKGIVLYCRRCDGEVYAGEPYYHLPQYGNICEKCIADYVAAKLRIA